MKRLKSYGDDLDSVGGSDEGRVRGKRRSDQDLDWSSSPRKVKDNGRKGLSSTSSYDRSLDDSRKVSISFRKQINHDSDGFCRTSSKKKFDRYGNYSDKDRDRNRGNRGIPISSPAKVGAGGDCSHSHQSDGLFGYPRDHPKGIRSQRTRLRIEGSVSSRQEETNVLSWRRASANKNSAVDPRHTSDSSRGTKNSNIASEDRVNVSSPKGLSRDAVNSPRGLLRDVKSPQGLSRDVVKSPRGLSRDVVKSSRGSSRDVVKSPRGSSRDVVKSPQGSSRDVLKSQELSRDVIKSRQGLLTNVVKSPQGSLTNVVKSPPMRKDSRCEQPKSVEMKKHDKVQRKSGNCSEREEGELEPEPENESIKKPKPPEPEQKLTPTCISEMLIADNQELESNNQIDPEIKDSISLSVEKLEGTTDVMLKEEISGLFICPGTVRETGIVPYSESNSVNGIDGSKEEDNETSVELEGSVIPEIDCTTNDKAKNPGKQIENESESTKKLLPFKELQKVGPVVDLEIKVEEVNLFDSCEEVAVRNRALDVALKLINDTNDKGKSLAASPSIEANNNGTGRWMDRDLLPSRKDAMEGPSTRGFELFPSPVINKHKNEKLKSESLELCLGLPNVSIDPIRNSSSPSYARSQSFPTTLCSSSDAFTTSISNSGSQTFVHNLSFSMTHNSLDYEQSLGSHPIFQKVDQASTGTWWDQSLFDPKRKEVPHYNRILLSGNGSSNTPQKSLGNLNPQEFRGQQRRVSEGSSSGVPVWLDTQLSLSRQLSGLQSRQHHDIRLTASMGSQNTRSEYSNKKSLLRETSSGSLIRNDIQRESQQKLARSGTCFGEKIIAMIVSEPILVMASRFPEMTEQSIAYLKNIAYEMMMHEDKCGPLQKILQKRSDITLETLLKSHRVQLEILVAFKTNVQNFLQLSKDMPISDLANIFLNMKCRNPACRSPIPVNDCDCKICLQKNGFCSACMCVVCSKFDMAWNTCSWVGCDVCFHWCHTDCGLRESFIRDGQSVTGAHGGTEVQFHCVACDHPSEMFGFVEVVFKSCAKKWDVGTFSKELKHVKRIFATSNDWRGRKLHDIASHLLPRLENKSNLSEVYNFIMRFLTESDVKLGNSLTFTTKETPIENLGKGSSCGGLGPIQESNWLPASSSTEKASPRVETGAVAHPVLDWEHVVESRQNGKPRQESGINTDMKLALVKLESILRIKKAEAKMFQERANNAREEAQGLKRVAIAKNEKFEEEYRSRMRNLCLVETKERRKQKLGELQVLEREHRKLLDIKMGMESEANDLLLQMESTSRSLVHGTETDTSPG
ncbi:hypothetical protein MKW94_008965 [Papaver nudicaule]|uniref:Uncharacterized protein n=1 Tax=Papaver nudicaule TaxID=74823 RepID=A0AA41S6N5_PAPNU|nr:hypothetical protein [Papaver nudicaule]